MPVVVQLFARIEVALREQILRQRELRIHVEHKHAADFQMRSDARERLVQNIGIENVVERIIQTRRGIEAFALIELA